MFIFRHNSQVELVKISPQPGQNCHQAENWHRFSLEYTELPKKKPHRFGHRKPLFRTVKNRPCPDEMSKKKVVQTIKYYTPLERIFCAEQLFCLQFFLKIKPINVVTFLSLEILTFVSNHGHKTSEPW